jgi:ribonuclease Z
MGAARPGRKLALSGDTRPCDALVEAARQADVLIHESTFSDDDQARALETRHSTAREAGRVAQQAAARRLILTHLSSRYDTDFGRLLSQAREEFQGPVDVAHDGFTMDVPVRE